MKRLEQGLGSPSPMVEAFQDSMRPLQISQKYCTAHLESKASKPWPAAVSTPSAFHGEDIKQVIETNQRLNGLHVRATIN